MSYRRGAIVLVPFPFTDFSHLKTRPAVVVSSEYINTRSPDVILVAISSIVPSVPHDLEVVLHQSSPVFRATGLRTSSVVKAAKLITIEQSLIYTTLGHLDDQTLLEVDKRISRALGLRKG